MIRSSNSAASESRSWEYALSIRSSGVWASDGSGISRSGGAGTRVGAAGCACRSCGDRKFRNSSNRESTSLSARSAKAGSRTLRFAAVEAAQGAWRETNPWHRHYSDVKARTGKANPARSAVARKVLIACWHVLSREEPFKPSRPHNDLVPASSSCFLVA